MQRMQGAISDGMSKVLAAAGAVWPTITVSMERFAAYVIARIPACSDTDELAALRVSDLYLACACADGDPAAIAAFEHQCIAGIDRVLHKLGIDGDAVAEVKQRVRHALLVSSTGAPKITSFAGRGDLRRWVRVMAVREALALIGATRRHGSDDGDQLAQLVGSDDDIEADYFKRTYRGEFHAAFGEAVEQLTDRDRLILSQHYLDGVTVNELARQQRVHRATVTRWLNSARRELLAATRRRLTQRLDIAPCEFESIMRLIHSQIAISLGNALRVRR